MKRIAIVFSGQTRGYNDIPKIWESYQSLEQKLYETYPDLETIDYYGHTWDDQPLPFNKDDFVDVVVSSQSEIDDWVNEDFFSRAYQNPHNEEWQDFRKQLFDDPHKVLNRMLYNSRAAYGQIFSFFHSIAHISHDYDAYFRTRWDLVIEQPDGVNIFFGEACKKEHPALMLNTRTYMKPLEKSNYSIRADRRDWFMDDTHFILNHSGMGKYKQIGKELWNYLENIVTSFERRSTTPSSHTLWGLVHPSEIRGYPSIQGGSCQLIRTPKHYIYKEDVDKWGI